MHSDRTRAVKMLIMARKVKYSKSRKNGNVDSSTCANQ
ncbi:hypothetical protein ACIQLR_002438 [Photobacterium damselae]